MCQSSSKDGGVNKCEHTACPQGTVMAVLGETEKGDSQLTTVEQERVLSGGSSWVSRAGVLLRAGSVMLE